MTCTHCGSHYINSDGRCGLCARQLIHPPSIPEQSKNELIAECTRLNETERKQYKKKGQLKFNGLTFEQRMEKQREYDRKYRAKHKERIRERRKQARIRESEVQL